MGKKMKIVSVVLFLADVGTDIYVALKHRQNGDQLWFILTVVFIGTPFLFGFFVACCRRTLYGVKDLEETLVLTRYMEAMYESAPQWCLQAYIMLLKWEFPWYTMISTVFSLLGLTWSALGLERKILKDEYDDEVYVVASFFHELSGFISRLVVIAAFAYAFTPWLLAAAFAIHILLLVLIPSYIEKRCCGSENYSNKLRCLEICGYCLNIVSLYLFLPFLLHPSKAIFALFKNAKDRLKTYYRWIYIMIVVGNIIMLTLVVTCDPQGEVAHMDTVRSFTIGCVIGATVINLSLLIFKCCISKKNVVHPDPAAASEENQEITS